MDSSIGFFRFIFSENPKDFKAAYESLHHNPYQIFDLLLKEERSTNFFSRIQVYGTNLANLLSQFPRFQNDDYSTLSLQASVRAFALSLLTERFSDMESRSVVARIVQELAKFIDVVPWEFRNANLSFDCELKDTSKDEYTRVRDYSFQQNTQLKVFEYLLGEPLGPWKIVLSQHAMENLETVNIKGNFENVRRKLSELASGDWAGKKVLHRAKWNNSLSYPIPLFKAFYKTEHFILWQIDTGFDERLGEDCQVIKVWAIGKPKNVDRIAMQIHRAQQICTKARVGAGNRDDLHGSREIRHLVIGEGTGAMGVDATSNEDFGSAQPAKFYTLTRNLLDNIVSSAGKVAYPVNVSAEEAAVVDHFHTPAFILGRSGTGKTTCLIYKLAGRYICSRENEEPLRQVLLTRSKRLASKLRDNTEGLLTAKLGERRKLTVGNDTKNDLDDNTRKQFLSLTDTDFPLVCTFDYLLKLIENSIREQESRRRYIKIDSSKYTRVTDFAKFNIEYWKRLVPGSKGRISVDLAFLEIMGVIKGSVSPATNFKPLSRQEYLERSWKLGPSFASGVPRDAIYDIYEWYERAKKKRGDIDQADRIIGVMKSLEAFSSSDIFEDNVFEQKIRSLLHEIYVDEVQDQRASDIGMLLTLIQHPRGVHFAGDTAQCISKDALFRFANAKALFYQRFVNNTSDTRELKPVLLPLSHNFRSHKQILGVASLVMHLLYSGFPELVDKLPPEIGDNPGPKPTLYVGDNITDVLKFGEKMETPLPSDAQKRKFNEYGEARVILVRDEETRDKLRAELGRSSLVLTILQSKGMEFEDVFLYNFLSTSPYSHKLDILEDLFKSKHRTDLSPDEHLGPGGEGGNGKGSTLEARARPGSGHHTSANRRSYVDLAKYLNIVLCSELKHLYVGVTRACNRLRILESNICILEPVRRLFNQTATLLQRDEYPGPLLEILTKQEIGVQELHRRLSGGKTISAFRWREMGYQMIDDQQYSEALRCFEDAEDLHGITLANAYIAEENGLANRARGLLEVANLDFIKASNLFRQTDSIAKAVQCRKDGGDQKGAVEILVDNGAYEAAAWLAADAELFSETSEIYTKLNKHERALAGYARGKQFKQIFSYLRRFKSEIEPCCWKQYALLGYLGEYGGNDMIPDKFEKRALDFIGSPVEQEMIVSRLGLMNKLFELLSTNGKYMEAYKVGVSWGFLEDSVQLLSEKFLFKNLGEEQRAHLKTVCKFLQAEHIATNPWPRSREDSEVHKVLRAAVQRGSSLITLISPFVEMWNGINQDLYRFTWGGASVGMGKYGDMQTLSYVDILVTRSVYPNNQFQLPFDHIEHTLQDLRVISSHGTIPYSAQLYCGIYEIPSQPGEYILLKWSPFWDNSRLPPPPRPVDLESLRGQIVRHILGDIIPPLVSLDEGLQAIWRKEAGRRFLPPSMLAKTHPERVDWLARLCQIFSESSAITKGNRQPRDSVLQNWDWRFWKGALLEQMEFRSSCEQSLEVLFNIKYELKSREGKYRTLYSDLIEADTTGYRVEPALQMNVGGCMSSLLAQYQTSLFLDYKDQWKLALQGMRTRIMDRGNMGLKYGWEMITFVNQFLSETEAGDFPGRFCENIYNIVGAVGRAKDSLNFYSASVISLYEELTLCLIFLVRPYEFLIPDSWHRLYFHRWERKYRSPSVLERFQYQQCLAKVCLSFCEMVKNIEGRPTKEMALAQRSVTVIVVCLINLGTFFPRPREYTELWRKSQEVFLCDGLHARGIQKLREDQLIGRLTKVFREYKGKDSIRLVRGHEGWVDSFAGIPLNGNWISVVKSRPTPEKKRHLMKMSRDPLTRQLNAAHVLTAFWKLNGPRVLEKMRERRRYFASRAKYPKNCCLLVGMEGKRNWTY